MPSKVPSLSQDHLQAIQPIDPQPVQPIQPRLIEFAVRWQFVDQNERAVAQQHFLELCEVLGVQRPIDEDPTGRHFAFEKGVVKTDGSGNGFADVWYRGHFAWEYKGKKRDLAAAYRQLLNYREDLDNPPLLIVSDMDRFEVHTNFTDTKKAVYAFDLADLVRGKPSPTCSLPPVEVLRALWESPERLRPGETRTKVTEAAAAEFGRLAESLRDRNVPTQESARFLIRLLFCMFSEDVGLLPNNVFTRLLKNTKSRPSVFTSQLNELWGAMATGGWFGSEEIRYFNGGMFTPNSSLIVALTTSDLLILSELAEQDWQEIEPAILGTLFERGLDPAKRSQLGAHYTSRDDISAIVEPVLMAPLRRRWSEVRAECLTLVEKRTSLMQTRPGHAPTAGESRKARDIDVKLELLLRAFIDQLCSIRVLDPACGSGNFLYVAMRELLDLEKAVIVFGTVVCGLSGSFPRVGPEQMAGLEISEFAHDLATATIQIGYLQWLRDNGFGTVEDPILTQLDLIRHADALITVDQATGLVTKTQWPEAEIIIGNPPFLGDKRMRTELGHEYVERLRQCYEGSVPGGADLVTYWFERSSALIAEGKVKRAGLLATNSIRKGENSRVLEKIKATGDIFCAWSDRPWIQDGAAVRVSIVCFDGGDEKLRQLNGAEVTGINTELSSGSDMNNAVELNENRGIVFLGMMKAGPFDVDKATAAKMLGSPKNPNGRFNTDVIKKRLGATDITGRSRDGWIIDFGVDMPESDACLYEMPFEFVKANVKPIRDLNRRESMRRKWWIHGEPRRALRASLDGLARCIVTPEVAKHRIFVWMQTCTIPDHTCHVFARDDDYFFGVLHSSIHEVWSLAVCNWMGVGNDPRYNSSRTFGTFPMPWVPGTEPKPEDDERVARIASAAKRLSDMRDKWLNPEGTDPAGLTFVSPKVERDAGSSRRTLTGLYNARPTWLAHAHEELDQAVLAAYGWPGDSTKDEILERLLALNVLRRQP